METKQRETYTLTDLEEQITFLQKELYHAVKVEDFGKAAKIKPQIDALKETKKGIVNLLYKLRSGKIPTEALVSLSTIIYYLQSNQFNKANESYMKLSIGNVCWPIGVVNVGIHARSSSLRITGSKNVSNIMMNELTRKWIISVKRLINFKERRYNQSGV